MHSFIPQINFDISDGEAIEFITLNISTKKWKFGEKVFELFNKNSTSKISLLFNIGAPKIGKSDLINKVALKPISEENTKGIMIYSKPFFKKIDNLSVYFVDVQGFLQNDQYFKNVVWSLIFLFGGMVIFSTQGSDPASSWIQYQGIDLVLNIIQISKSIHENEFMLPSLSPKMLWILKDLPQNMANSSFDGKCFVQESIRTKLQSRQICGETKILNYFSDFFPNFEVISFFKEDQHPIFDISTEKMSPHFQENVKKVREVIFSNSKPKKMSNFYLNFSIFNKFSQIIFEKLNQVSFIDYNLMFNNKI